MSELPKVSKKRSENWTHEELLVLVQKYNSNKETLDGKFSQVVSKLTKDDIWSKIADQVSVVGSDRTVQQCKKKLSDQKSDSKAKGIPGGIDTHQKLGRIDLDEEVNFDIIAGNFVLQPVEKLDTQFIETTNTENTPQIYKTEHCNEYSKKYSQPDKKEDYIKRKTPLRRSLSSLAKLSSPPFSEQLTTPLTSITDVRLESSANPALILQNGNDAVIPLMTKKDNRYKKPVRKTTSRKLSSSNVDGYMTNMSKIGEELVATGQKIYTVLSRSIPSDSLFFEGIAETLNRIATSAESLASSAKRIACSLETIAMVDSENK